MLIGELSRATGRSVHTLRWYERQGLLPHVQRDGGRRRVYTSAHIDWLRLLERLALSGMPVSQMQAYADLVADGRRSLKARQALLATHRRKVEARMRDLAAALDLVDQKLDFYRQWESTGIQPEWRPRWTGAEGGTKSRAAADGPKGGST